MGMADWEAQRMDALAGARDGESWAAGIHYSPAAMATARREYRRLVRAINYLRKRVRFAIGTEVTDGYFAYTVAAVSPDGWVTARMRNCGLVVRVRIEMLRPNH